VRAVYRWLPAIVVVSTIFWFSHQPTWPDFAVGIPDWLLHGVAYVAVGLTFWYGMGGDRDRPLAPGALVMALLLASGYGALDEFHQSFVTARSATVSDWLADSFGALVGVLVAQAAAFAGPRRLWENRNT
jgi:VanZ family protein